MTIDFENIKRNNITKELIISLIEKIYLMVKSEKEQNIVINEFVDDMSTDSKTNHYTISLANNPISMNDIMIFSENGELVITPKNILSLDKNKVTFTNSKIKNKMNFYVTYKY